MAAEVSSIPVNGTYAPQHNFDQQQAYAQQAYTQAPPASTTPASTAPSQPEIPKDEVGWYFVEQYYTTLSRTPEKLYVRCMKIVLCLDKFADLSSAILQQALPVRVRKRDRQGPGLRWPEGKEHRKIAHIKHAV